jgi:hypothetical protein
MPDFGAVWAYVDEGVLHRLRDFPPARMIV